MDSSFRSWKTMGAVLICACTAMSQAETQRATAFFETPDVARAFVLNERRCGTASPPVAARAAVREASGQLKKAGVDAATIGPVDVETRCVVIHYGDIGRVPASSIEAQIQVLNNDFAVMQVKFALVQTVYFDAAKESKPEWFRMRYASAAERAAKRHLGKGQGLYLNLYIAEPVNHRGQSILGWATFPTDLDGDPQLDGVVLRHDTLPGGTGAPYNLGRTGTHECGHWLGLMHTFEGGCFGFGDEVDDTPAHSETTDCDHNNVPDIFECSGESPACDGAARAPFTNFMNYSPDACMKEFTLGQVERVRVQLAMFRTGLLREPAENGARQRVRRLAEEFQRVAAPPGK